jgi:hypothetical protein
MVVNRSYMAIWQKKQVNKMYRFLGFCWDNYRYANNRLGSKLVGGSKQIHHKVITIGERVRLLAKGTKLDTIIFLNRALSSLVSVLL